MADGLNGYAEYKDSGVEWLGAIPAHWGIYPNRNLFTEVNERGYPDEQMLSVTIGQGVIPQRQLLVDSSKKDSSNQDKSKYKLVSVGDITYNKMRAWQGAIGAASYRGIISPAYIVVRPHEQLNSWYFHYLFRTPAFATEAERWSYGITSDQWSLRYSEFKQIYAPLPPLDEQTAIVHFLEVADQRIRRYIRAKQKLIKLLNEQKQAIIQQAVTQGLDPNVPMKESGVEWLGEIPAHWKIRRCKSLFREVDVRTDTGEETLLSLRMYQGLVPHNEVSERPISSAQLVGYKFTQPGQIVMNRMRAASGLFAVTPRPGLVSPDYAIFETSEEVFAPYYVNLFKSPLMRHVFRINSKGLGTGSSGFLRLYTERFGVIPVPCPPTTEQREIVVRLNDLTASFDDAIRNYERDLSLVREYRSRLISDAVTGKVDVRETAFTLPTELVEGETVDVSEDELDELNDDVEFEELIDAE